MQHPRRAFTIRLGSGVSLTLAALCAGALCVAPPAPSAGQVAQPSTALNGTWRLVGSVAEAQQSVAQAIEPAVAPLAPDIQRMARARIAESTWVPQTVTIGASAAEISVHVVGSMDKTFRGAPGEGVNVYSPSGVRARLTQSFRPDGGIQQSFRTMDGIQHNIYTLHGDQLLLDVSMESPRLRATIQFRIRYQRG